MADVVLYEVFEEEADALRRCWPKEIKAKFTDKTIQERRPSFPHSPFICVRTQSIIPESWASKLKGILTRSAGYDHLLAYLQKTGKKIPCGYLPQYCARAVAEHAVMVAFELLRKTKKQQRQFASFNRDGLTGKELLGKNILVLGVGNIGSQIVEIAQGLNMQVKGFDRDKKKKTLEYVSLEQGLRWADVIVCALSLNKETKGLLDKKNLSSAKKGAVFINIARGEISPTKDLLALLEEGHLGGLGLDVFEEEALFAGALRGRKKLGDQHKKVLKLMERDDVLLTPHNAFNTEEAVMRKAQQTAEAARMFLKERKFPFPVPAE